MLTLLKKNPLLILAVFQDSAKLVHTILIGTVAIYISILLQLKTINCALKF